QHARVLDREAAPRRARSEQHRRRGRGLPEADRLDVRADELHRVVDRHQRRERAAGRVDVHADLAVRVGRLQAQQLRHDVVGRRVVDLHPEEDDALLEELVVRVRLLDPVARALDEGRQHVPRLRRLRGPPARRPHVAHRALPFWFESGIWLARVMTWSTKPYSSASCAVNHRSRSKSAMIRSTVCPVCSAMSSAISRLWRLNSSAWMEMSDSVPPTPADGWCMRIWQCGSTYRLPRVPAESRNCPIDAAMPIPNVATSHGMNCMVS